MLDFIHWIEKNIRRLVYVLLEFFDKSPERLEHESMEEYFVRIDKKYAVRQLNNYLNLIPEYNIDVINELLSKEKNVFTKKLLKLMKGVAVKRIQLRLIRDRL